MNRFRGGDEKAAELLFLRYVERLTAIARAHLAPKLAVRTDPEDVVMSAYRSFFLGVRNGRFSLDRSGALWRLLVAITRHKIYRQARRHLATSRSVRSEVVATDKDFLSRQPPPEQAIDMADELESLFNRLEPFARRVLELRLQEESLASISEQTGRSERTIRRTLSAIRESLERRLDIGDA